MRRTAVADAIIVMALSTLKLAHLPSDLWVHAALFKDLRNAQYLRNQLLSGNSDFEYAFIDASKVNLWNLQV